MSLVHGRQPEGEEVSNTNPVLIGVKGSDDKVYMLEVDANKRLPVSAVDLEGKIDALNAKIDAIINGTAPAVMQLSGSNIPDAEPVPTNMVTSLDSDYDSINVDKMGKGGVVSAVALGLSAITATTTSNEFSAEGFNALLVEATVSAIASGNWVIELQGALATGGTVGQYVDTLGIATPALTNKHISPQLNADGVYIIVFRGVADFNKLVCTRTTDGTLSVRVQPLNL